MGGEQRIYVPHQPSHKKDAQDQVPWPSLRLGFAQMCFDRSTSVLACSISGFVREDALCYTESNFATPMMPCILSAFYLHSFKQGMQRVPGQPPFEVMGALLPPPLPRARERGRERSAGTYCSIEGVPHKCLKDIFK